jgi:hypothetical protein
VFFLLRKKKTGGGKEPFYFCGTSFAVSVGFEGHEIGKSDWVGGIDYAVTAAHVVKNTPANEELYLRVNAVSGPPIDIPVPVSMWKSHATTDVAACPVSWPEDKQLDVMTIPIARLPQGPEGIYANQVMEGEEVIICGLLTSFPGSERIQPIVRTGKIALMPYEKMRVELDRRTSGDVDAYLLEMISWPGLSGSPIIVYPNRNPRNPRSFDFFLPYLVLGLIHGNLEYDKEVKFSRERTTVRLGSGTQRLELFEQIKSEKQPIAAPHLNEKLASFSQQDFEQALRKASRRVQTSKSDAEKK